MKRPRLNRVLLVLLAYLITGYSLQASELNIPNQFSGGTRAVAVDVNANFDAVATAVNDNQSQLNALLMRLDVLAAENAALQASIAVLQDDQVVGLAMYLSIDTNLDQVVFSGANVHVNNGLGGSTSINGVGNLIVGYDETTSSSRLMCSDGQLLSQTDCEAAGETWNSIHKTGSHNVIIGPGHNYSRTGGFLAGFRNNVLAHNTSVSGGNNNTASGDSSSVSGGGSNTAIGDNSSVSGGFANAASGVDSSISGGIDNTASASTSSVSGGSNNTASGGASSVSGGVSNAASGDFSSISGGSSNTSSGSRSSISGGFNREVPDDFDWAAGALFEDF